jgi:hypothetical protein
MAKITVGLSRKRPGSESYSSNAFHLSVEAEADIKTRAEFAERVHSLFSEVERCLDDEIARRSPQHVPSTSRRDFWSGNGGNGGGHAEPQKRDRSHSSPGGNGGGNGKGAEQQGSDNGASASAKQIQFIFRLARRAGMTTQADLAQWVKENFGTANTPYQMSRAEASKVIDLLNAKGAASQ